MVCGIYVIKNTVSDKCYVGSSVDIEKRTYKHFFYLAAAKHPSARLTAAYSVHGRDAFTWDVLEECAPEKLLERENYWIGLLRPNYNARLIANSNLGLILSEESRSKQSATLKVTSATPEARARLKQTVLDAWADPDNREKRITSLKRAWDDPKKRADWSVMMKGVDTKTDAARAIRWAKPGAKERASEALRVSHANRGANKTLDDIRAKVASTLGWSVVSITGPRMADKVVIHCDIHGTDETHSIQKAWHTGRGCRRCGFDRSSAKQKGIPKPPKGILP